MKENSALSKGSINNGGIPDISEGAQLRTICKATLLIHKISIAFYKQNSSRALTKSAK